MKHRQSIAQLNSFTRSKPPQCFLLRPQILQCCFRMLSTSTRNPHTAKVSDCRPMLSVLCVPIHHILRRSQTNTLYHHDIGYNPRFRVCFEVGWSNIIKTPLEGASIPTVISLQLQSAVTLQSNVMRTLSVNYPPLGVYILHQCVVLLPRGFFYLDF